MDELFACVMFEQKTTEPAVLQHVLGILSSLAPLAPSYWGQLERKRLPWDIGALVAFVQELKSKYPFVARALPLWRTSAPKYTGSLLAGDRTVNAMTFTFSPAPSAKALPAVYEAIGELVKNVPTVFAFVHPIWRTGPEVEAAPRAAVSQYIYSGGGSDQALYERGIPGVFSRTWFGPLLVERIARERLLGIIGAREDQADRIVLDLAAEPWKATLSELAARKEQVLGQLKSSGMFMDVECDDHGGFTRRENAPGWAPPDWVMRAKRKDEES